MTAPRHAIVDQQLVDDTLGRVMAIGDDFADIRPAAARPHPLAGAAAARIVADRVRARLDRDMVRRSAGERVAPCERRERPFAAEIADRFVNRGDAFARHDRSEEHTSELQSLMRISYAVFCLKKKNIKDQAYQD